MGILQGDIESAKTLDEAIDRVKAEIVNPILAELANLRGELAAWRAMLSRINLGQQ